MKRSFLHPATLPLWAGSLALVLSAGCGQEAEGPGRFIAPPDARPVAYHQEQVMIEEGPVAEMENPFVQETARPQDVSDDSEPLHTIPPAESALSLQAPKSASSIPSSPTPKLTLSPARPQGKAASTAPDEGQVLLIGPRSGSDRVNLSREESARKIPMSSSPMSVELTQSPTPPAERKDMPRMERTPPVLLLGESRRAKAQFSNSQPSNPAAPVPPNPSRVANRPSGDSTPIKRPANDTQIAAPAPKLAATQQTTSTEAPPAARKTQPAATITQPAESESRPAGGPLFVPQKASPPVLTATIPLRQVSLPPTAADNRTMDAVRMRARGLFENGMSLAHRGAYYSARAEFIQAMRLITQTLDTQQSTREHSAALSSGLVALDEASAFIPEGAKLEADLDLPMIIRSHRTPALKEEDLKELTPLAAVQAYFGYAQEKLRFAAGGVPEATQALFGLAKLQEFMHGGESGNRALIGPRSIALYQTALSIDPTHAETANELGVLLARYGQYEDAKHALLQGLRSRPYAESWNNLARVHELLGEPDLAQLARQEAAAPQARGGNQVVRWTTPEEFTDEGRPTLRQPSQATSRPAESTARGGSRAASRR
ncbi:MAG: tetratricopeptide repeat protein [Pirellulaceae bacterium]